MHEFQAFETVAAPPGTLGGPRTERRRINATDGAIVARLPQTADGIPITPGMVIYVVRGVHVDEREVIGPYGIKALLFREPGLYGGGSGSCHCLAEKVFANRDGAIAAAAEATRVE